MKLEKKDSTRMSSNKINQELKELEMKNAKITCKSGKTEKNIIKNGKDNVAFYIQTNIGEDEKELSKNSIRRRNIKNNARNKKSTSRYRRSTNTNI